MDSQKQSIIDRLKQANNILVTVSANPSVDQLAACIGLTLMMDALDKHATAVYSGATPSTLEFLKPEKTLEKNTDSLRDFIIALDKSKADKLRYKVEDKVVRIFITPYRTSISDKDLQFSQGDFNVDVVVCLGVHEQKDLDQAITAHGRILHDATVVSINTATASTLGTLNWQNPQASSLSEMVASLADGFDKKNLLDTQIATALLTGVVAETDRFSNSKTSPDTMKVSAQLMSAGANQQLVATKLEEPQPLPPPPPAPVPPGSPPPAEPPSANDGTLRIEHEPNEVKLPPVQSPENEVPPPPPEPQIHIDDQGKLHRLDGEEREFLDGPGPTGPLDSLGLPSTEDEERPSGAPPPELSSMALTPPPGSPLSANIHPEGPSAGPPPEPPILAHDNSSSAPPEPQPAPPEPSQAGNPQPVPPPAPEPVAPPSPPASAPLPSSPVSAPPPLEPPSAAASPSGLVTAIANNNGNTLDKIEELVGSPHYIVSPQNATPATPPSSDEDAARSAVESAIDEAPFDPAGHPTVAAGAQRLDELHLPATKTTQPDDDADNDAPSGPPPPPTEPLGTLAEPLPPSAHESAPATASPSTQPLNMPLPPLTPPPANPTPPTSSDNASPSGPPPPAPPPFMPPTEPNGQ